MHAPVQVTTFSSFPWAIVLLNFFATFTLAFPFYTSYVALPHMMVSMSANLALMQWVLTGYVMSQTVMMPMVGWLSHRLGLRRLFMFSLALTMLGSVGSGLAWNAGLLITCRILQGIGAGPLSPLATVIVFDAFPAGQRGIALGMNSTIWAIGALIALPLGGYLIEALSWRVIFFCGVPAGLIALVIAWRALREGPETTPSQLDGWGLGMLLGFLVPLLFGLSQGQLQGWDAGLIQLSFAMTVLVGVTFTVYQFCHAAPLLDLRLLRNLPFAMSCLVRFLNHIAFNAYSLLITLFLQTTLEYSPLQAGITLLPAALAVVPASLLIGRLTDRFDARLIFLSGLTLNAFGAYLFAAVTTWTPLAWVMMVVVMLRVGSECLFVPLNYTGMQLLPVASRRMGAGLLSVMWGVGGAVGNATIAAVLHYLRAIHRLAAEQSTADNAGNLEHALHQIRTLLQETNGVAAATDSTAQLVLENHLTQSVAITAYQDCFLLITGVYLLTMLPTLFIRVPRGEPLPFPPPPPPTMTALNGQQDRDHARPVVVGPR